MDIPAIAHPGHGACVCVWGDVRHLSIYLPNYPTRIYLSILPVVSILANRTLPFSAAYLILSCYHLDLLVYLSTDPPAYLFVDRSIHLSIYLSISPGIMLSHPI